MSDWDVVGSFLTRVDSSKPGGNFDDWYGRLWKPIEEKCFQVAQHHYVMTKALETFEGDFDAQKEEDKLRELCRQVGLEGNEFVSMAFKRHRDACYKKNREK